jgi:hypothetical protein
MRAVTNIDKYSPRCGMQPVQVKSRADRKISSSRQRILRLLYAGELDRPHHETDDLTRARRLDNRETRHGYENE